MIRQYVTKTYKQRTTVVTSVPKAVRQQLELTRGGHLLWEVDENSDFVQCSSVVPRGKNYERSGGNSDRKD